MDEKLVRRRELLKKAGFWGTAGALALASGPADAGTDRGNGLVGLWDVAVSGAATYFYTYSFSRDAFVAAGNIDYNWDGQGSSFGPTMGAHARQGRRTYAILEKGWAFDPSGQPAGWFTFAGTYVVDKMGQSLTGSGTWTLYDLSGNAVFVEPLTVSGTRLA